MNLKKIIVFLICISPFFQCINAQTNRENNIVGENYILKSKILNEDRTLQVYLPENYFKTKKKYPVLYVIDGQRYFLNGITFQQNLTWENLIPEFLVVGIITDSQKRRDLFYKESSKFIQFLEKELIPSIDKDYRTLDDRIYFGWEMAAGLGLQIMTQSPSLFKGYLLSSPTHVSANRLDNVKKLLNNNRPHNLFIYASLGTVENWALESMTILDSVFKQYQGKNIKWNYNLSENENHYTTPLVTFNKGLRKYYSDYGPLRFYTLKEFNNFGGIKALKTYYNNRGSKYQISTDIHLDTKHFILWQSVKENDFSLFEQLVKELDGKTFIKNYYNQARWFNSYATFYLVNNKLDEALETLEIGLKKFPNNSVLYNGMGNYFKANGEVKKAEYWYKKAIRTAENNGDPKLSEYKKNLRNH